MARSLVLQQPYLPERDTIKVTRSGKSYGCHIDTLSLAHDSQRPNIPAVMPDNVEQKKYDCLTNNPTLQRYLSRNTQSKDEAADIYQESVARVLEQGRDKVITNPIAYAFRVAKSLLLRQPQSSQDDIDNLDHPHSNPEYLLDREQRITLIYDALNNMPSRRREVFERRRIQGESREAIAQQMGITVEAVTRHISRAMADIQQYLDKKAE